MNKLFVWILMLVVVASAGTLTRDEAYQRITDNLLMGDLDGRSILAMNRLVQGSDYVSDMHGQTFRAPSTSYFFLVEFSAHFITCISRGLRRQCSHSVLHSAPSKWFRWY